MDAKDLAAQVLVDWHFRIEAELVKVFRIIADDEGEPNEPIKLLEVNAATLASGSVMPFAFAKTNSIPYRTVIAEVTPDEFELIQHEKLSLPEGWSLTGAKQFVRPHAA
jgi:hypothetical protein